MPSGRLDVCALRSAPPNHLSLRSAVGILVLLLAAAPLAAARYPFGDGETVTITGSVIDPEGAPIEGVQVVLEASRKGLTLRPPGRVKKELERHATTTDRAGAFEIHWPWNGRYNSFELLVGVPFRRLEGERLKIVARQDISRRLKQGSPAVIAMAVADMTFLRSIREFLAGLEGDAQERTYHELGKPDRVERLELPGSTEVSWWYFAQGKVVRFRNGSLIETGSFDPVTPFEEGAQ